jgi:hypothetical protein
MDKRDTSMSCGRLFLTDDFFYRTFSPSQSKFLSLNCFNGIVVVLTEERNKCLDFPLDTAWYLSCC